MNPQEEERIQQYIARYQKGIFALVVYLIGGDKNTAYPITVNVFSKVLPMVNSLSFDEEKFYIKLIREAVLQSRKARAMPVADGGDFTHLTGEKRKALDMTRAALLALSFDDKLILILRDQMRLPYRIIAAVVKKSEKIVRVDSNHARLRLRKKLEGVLKAQG